MTPLFSSSHLQTLSQLLTFTASPIMDSECQDACGKLFKKIWKLSGRPEGDPDFGKKAFLNEGGYSITAAVRLQALQHIIAKNTHLYLSATVDALQLPNLALAHGLLNQLEMFDPKTSDSIKRICSDLLTSENVSKIQDAVEKVFIEKALIAWVARGAPGELCLAAKEKFTTYLEDPRNPALNLENLKLKSLPNIFNAEKFKKLKSIYLNKNQLTALPDSFLNLTQLEELYLSNNQLTSLPDFLGKLTQLTSLLLDNNQLTSLPSFLGNLTQLIFLHLGDNQLTSLPDFLGNLTQLIWLHLGDNQLTSLPVSLSKLTQLTWLYLHNNQLTSLPESLGNLTQLKKLILRNNQLTSLPVYLTNLTHRTIFDIDLSNNPLEGKISEAQPFYEGIRIPLFPRLTCDKTNVSKITTWLDTIKDLQAHYSAEAQTKTKELVREFLETAEKNEAFRPLFMAIIEEAMNSCIDGITLSFMHLRIALLRLNIDTLSLPQMKETLRVFLILSMLEKIAKEKIRDLRDAGNPITNVEREALLIYPALLKERFNLPVDVTEMTFARLTHITDGDIQAAQLAVEAVITDPHSLHQALLKDPLWENALKLKDPKGYREVQARILALAENPDTTPEILTRLLTDFSITTMDSSLPDVRKEFVPSLLSLATMTFQVSEKEILLTMDSLNRLTSSDIRAEILYIYNTMKSEEYPSLSPSYEGCVDTLKCVDPLLLLQIAKDLLLTQSSPL